MKRAENIERTADGGLEEDQWDLGDSTIAHLYNGSLLSVAFRWNFVSAITSGYHDRGQNQKQLAEVCWIYVEACPRSHLEDKVNLLGGTIGSHLIEPTVRMGVTVMEG